MTRRPSSVRLPLAATGIVLIGVTLALTHFDRKLTLTLTNPPGPTASVIEWELPVAIEGSLDFNSVYEEPTTVGWKLVEVDDAAGPAQDWIRWGSYKSVGRGTRRVSIPLTTLPTMKAGKTLALEIEIGTPAHPHRIFRPNTARPDGKFLIRLR